MNRQRFARLCLEGERTAPKRADCLGREKGNEALPRSGSALWNQGEPAADAFAPNTKRNQVDLALEFDATLMRRY